MPITLARVVAVSALLTLAAPGIGLGHDGLTGVFVDPPRVNPGGVIVVTGHKIATDEPVVVSLAGADGAGTGRPSPTARATSPSEPRSQPETAVGPYTVEVSGLAGVYMSTNLLVEGSPIFDGQNGAPAGQDEGLPASAVGPRPGATGDRAPRTSSPPPRHPTSISSRSWRLALAVGALGPVSAHTRRPTASPRPDRPSCPSIGA